MNDDSSQLVCLIEPCAPFVVGCVTHSDETGATDEKKWDVDYQSRLRLHDENRVQLAHSNDSWLIGLWENKTFCDIEIISSDKHVFKVHRAVLAVRSSVFASAIDHILRSGGADSKSGVALDSKSVVVTEDRNHKKSDEKDQKSEKDEKLSLQLPMPFTSGGMDGKMLQLGVCHDERVMNVILRYAYLSRHFWSTDMNLNYSIISAAIKFQLKPLVWEGRALFVNGLSAQEIARDLLLFIDMISICGPEDVAPALLLQKRNFANLFSANAMPFSTLCFI